MHGRVSPAANRNGYSLVLFLALALASAPRTALALRPLEPLPAATAPISLLRLADHQSTADILHVELRPSALDALMSVTRPTAVEFPLSSTDRLTLDLEPYTVTTPATRFLRAGPDGQSPLAAPAVRILRGRVRGEPRSTALLAFSDTGLVNGHVIRADGPTFVLSRAAQHDPASGLAIHRLSSAAGLPGFAEFCGTGDAHQIARPLIAPQFAPPLAPAARGAANQLGLRVLHVAIDADQAYVNLFPSEAAAAAYVVQLIAAVSDIYEANLNVKLVLSFVRLWPEGGEPFTATDIEDFLFYWYDNEDLTGLQLVHLFSGRRDTGYGGIAYVAGACSGFAFGISAFMLGGFPSPVDGPDLGNWDLVVVSHEMGHNMGTGHTHSAFNPPIDACASGIWSRGTIMSYCHTVPGGLLNTDVRFHARVREVIEADLQEFNDCYFFDCNNNGVDDALDIAGAASADANANGVPDECEDCNANGVLDPQDIALGAPDVNANGVPDVCEPDCNANGIPDAHDIALGAADDNGNLVPDSCEPDCNANAVADFVEIAAGSLLDVDRDQVPDVCQDCDDNGITDWIDAGRTLNVFLADQGEFIREYHRASGVAVGNLAAGAVVDPYDLVFGPDRAAYVASHGNNRIVRLDPDTGATSTFVAPGVGGLAAPSALTFGPDGHLYVSSRASNNVLRYDGATGASLGVFASGSGLTGPYGLAFGPNGNLFVASSDNRVLEFDGTTGAFVATFVTAGSGGLSAPRGLLFTPDGRLLVASSASGAVLEYGPAGAFIRTFNDFIAPLGAWGIRLGPNGNVFVVQTSTNLRVIEYDVTAGRFIRSYIRGDSGLSSPTGFDFRHAASFDCNANGRTDDCDLADATSQDVNGNNVPDECELIPGDIDGDGDVDLTDFSTFSVCFAGPGVTTPPEACPAEAFAAADLDGDGDVDLGDFSTFSTHYTG